MPRDSRIVFRQLVESSGLHVDEMLGELLDREDPWRGVQKHLGAKLFDHILSSRQLLRAVAQGRIQRDEAEELARHRKRVQGEVSSAIGRPSTELIRRDTTRTRASETWSPEDADEIEEVARMDTGRFLHPNGIPDVIGPFKIETVLGGGGMGQVYRGVDPDLDRPVAIKVIRPEKIDVDFQARFRAEAQTLAKFNHPNIVQVYRFGVEGGCSYIAMQFIEGRSLARWRREESPTVDVVVRIMITVCEAVDYAHERGVVHRDLKPENILIDSRGHAYVFDFGLAKITFSDTDLTASVVVGTPGYIAPEQADLGTVDAKSDVYGLGSILYYALTGRPPIQADSIYQYFLKLATESPTRPEELNREVDGVLSEIVMRSIAKDKGQRYASASHLAQALRRYLEGGGRMTTAEFEVPRTEADFDWSREHPDVAVTIPLFDRSDYNALREKVSSCLDSQFGWDGTDRLRVLMVLDELAGNAFEHGCRGRGEAEVRLRMTANTDRGRIAVEVSDDGPGFDLAGILSKAADPAKPGARRGRGLPMVRRISQTLATHSNGRVVRAELAKTHSNDYAGVVAPPVDPTPQIRTVAWKGHIDNFNYEEFSESVERAIADGRHVIVDMRGVTYICSSGMGALFDLSDRASAKGGQIAVVVTRKELRASLELFGLSMAATIVESPEDAARALEASA